MASSSPPFARSQSALRMRVDGQRHAIRALEKVIGDLRGRLGKVKGGSGGGGGGGRVVSPDRRKGGGPSATLHKR